MEICPLSLDVGARDELQKKQEFGVSCARMNTLAANHDGTADAVLL